VLLRNRLLLNTGGAQSAAAEFLGTAALVAAVVGSGIMATNLTPDVGLQLLINTFATILALGVLIASLGPISGAHFNPVVSLVEFWFKRLTWKQFTYYSIAQSGGGFSGAILANLMFNKPAIFPSHHLRNGSNLFLSEIVATAGLVLIILLLTNQGRTSLAAVLVPAWIGAAYFFTSSTSFANPAVTLARSQSDTFSGIDISSVPLFVLAQLLGAGVAILLSHILNSTDQKVRNSQ
jgi:glycerol uptake facilitator-like aquaporin